MKDAAVFAINHHPPGFVAVCGAGGKDQRRVVHFDASAFPSL